MAAILVAALIVQPVIAMAGSSGRLIPNGTVGILSDGKEVQQIRSEVPLPEGSLMVCNGNCIVQTHGLRLVAQDKSVFAVVLGNEGWKVAVKSGRIEFGVNSDAKPIAFLTPQDVIQVNQVIVPASTDSIVRGSLSVTEKGTQLSVEQGMLKVSYNGSEQLVQPGMPILLAQADGGAGAGAGAGGAGAGAGGAVAGGTILGMSTPTAAIVGTGIVVVGGVAGAAVGTSGSSSNSPS